MYWYVPDHPRREGAYPPSPNRTCSPSPQHVQYMNDEAWAFFLRHVSVWAWHRAQHPPSTSFARHCGVQIANRYINGLNRYLVLNETAVNVHNNGQWNGPLPNPENQILVQISTDKYNTVRLRMYWYVLIQDRWKIIYMFILVGTSTYKSVLVCTVLNPVSTLISTYQYIPVHNSTYKYVPVHTSTWVSMAALFCGRHDMVQGSTSSAVPYHEMSWYSTYWQILTGTDLSRCIGF